MIIVKLQGGLGNQMFQYAAGKTLSAKYYVPLFLDHSFLERNRQSDGHFIARKYELNVFNISSNRLSNDVVDQYFESGSDKKIYLYKEQPVSYDRGFKKIKPTVYLDGYWQSHRYFKDITEIIKLDFSFKKNELINKYSILINEILRGNSVSIHVRRGDYIPSAGTIKLYNMCTVEYYKKAVSILLKHYADAHFFVFSDDIKWAEENLKYDSTPIHFIHKSNDADWLDMYLMSLCKHNIIANSTFSWWAAWLNANSNKIVVAPEKWFNVERAGFNLNNLCPKDWIKI
jgi:hypothetical protein